MANYLTTDTDLTAVADAIRTKGGTSAQLAFPADFVTAIGAISTGGAVLLASGNYTLASDTTSSVAITISATGTAKQMFVVRESIASGVAHTYALYRQTKMSLPDDVTDVFTDGYVCTLRGIAANGSTSVVAAQTSSGSFAIYLDSNTNPTKITIRPYNNTYKFVAGTYKWFVWG